MVIVAGVLCYGMIILGEKSYHVYMCLNFPFIVDW